MSQQDNEIQLALYLTYGHFIRGFWIRFFQYEVPLYGSRVIVPDLKYFDLVFILILVVADEYIILGRTCMTVR